MRPLSSSLALPAFLFALAACGGGHVAALRAPAPAEMQATAAPTTAFTNVTVVPMTGAAEMQGATVVVRGDRIESVGTAAPPAGAHVIDGHGAWLAPGFADMHVHLPPDGPESAIRRIALLSLLNGVTTIRSMQGAPNHLAFRAHAREGVDPTPELFLGGPPLAETLTPDQARARVREQKAAGYDFIKVLGGFDRAAYDAVVDEARIMNIPVVGHVPAEIGIEAALAAHQRTIEHAMGYADAAKAGDAALDALARRTRDAGIWNCPTVDYYASQREDLSALEARDGLAYASPADVAEWRKREPSKAPRDAFDRLRHEVLALQRAGAGLLVGSDSPEPWILPGFGFREEMRELVNAGLTPAEVMTAATRSAAQALGRDPRDGTVQPGAVADLILVDGDPLATVNAAAHPAVVMVRGRAWTRGEIEGRIEPPKPAAP